MAKRYEVSDSRKGTYYGGMAVLALGIIIFISPAFAPLPEPPSTAGFISGRTGVDDMRRQSQQRQSNIAIRTLLGMALFFAGGIMIAIGRSGPAGSGLLLDPGREVTDLEPHTRAQGQMLGQILEEANLGRETTKVRCRSCQALSEETQRYCGQCGQPL